MIFSCVYSILLLWLIIRVCSSFEFRDRYKVLKVLSVEGLSDYHGYSELSSPYWNDSVDGSLPLVNFTNFKVPDLLTSHPCPVEDLVCDENGHYRRIDGFCNNERIPSFGSSEDMLGRLLQPVYDHGVIRMKSINGGLLPNPRVVSNYMKSMKRRVPENDANVFWLFFGQFVDHDFIFTPSATEGKPGVNCTSCNSWKTDSACAPILVPINDKAIPPFDKDGRRKCIPFRRSSAIPSKYEGGMPAFEQINSNTAFLDLSMVYGSDKCTEANLRLYHYGQMIEHKHPLSSRGMPPLELFDPSRDCRSKSGKCPKTGDDRNIEHLGLMLFPIVFLREHNRLAKNLHKLNTHWRDERIFQEARRINIAQYQRIVYEDFLPILIGEKLMETYDLTLSKDSYYFQGYDPNLNPQVLSEFATAAFRVGHSMVPDHIVKMDKFYLPKGSFSLESIFRNITFLYEANLLEEITRGMITSRIEGVDPVIQSSLADKLFKSFNRIAGRDLVAFNIARGRDHGLQGYAAYRKLCGLKPPHSWDDLEISQKDLKLLKKSYSTVHDIDLFVGGLTEIPTEGSLVGTTFSCIIAQQFLRTKKGDRFWFENERNNFSLDQLQAIKEGSALVRVLTLNLAHPLYLPRRPFNLPDKLKNPLIPPTSEKGLNLLLWEENESTEKDCHYKGETILHNHHVFISPCLSCFCNPRNDKISCVQVYDNCNRSSNDEACKLACGTS